MKIKDKFEVFDQTINAYKKQISKYGFSSKGVFWQNKDTQNARFEALSKGIIKSDIKSLEMCGNYGDPTANRNLFPILDVLKDNNIKVRVFTNGSAHKTSYWEELARRVGDNPVLFALDGADKRTYEYYRVNCIWEKTLENAKTFIDAGGWAVWSMVLFNWNEHQLDTAMEMADSMGFKHFHTIHSNRNTERGVGTHKIGKRFFSKVIPLCLDRKRLFLTARGNVFPCCWTASQYENTQTVPNIRDYDSLEECARKAENLDLVGEAHEYLKDCEIRKKISQEHFRATFEESEIYKSL